MDEIDKAPVNIDAHTEIRSEIPTISVQCDAESSRDYDSQPPDYESLDIDPEGPLTCDTGEVDIVVDREKWDSDTFSTDVHENQNTGLDESEDAPSIGTDEYLVSAATEGDVSALKSQFEATLEPHVDKSPTSLLRTRPEIKRSVSLRSMEAGNRMSRDVHREQMFLGAVADMNVKVAEDFIGSGIDVNCRSQYKRRTAIHELVKSFFMQYLDVNYDKLKTKFVEMLSNLIHLGLIINATDASRQTALHIAASYPDSCEIMTALMSSGLDSNIPDDTQQTALHKAVSKATVDDVCALIEGGANLHVLDAAGNAPIHLAAKRKFHPVIIKALLEPGSSANVRDDSSRMRGSTALHLAVKSGYMPNVVALVEGGAKVDLVDGSGQTVAHLAAAHDISGKILPLLLEKGADLNQQDDMLLETPLHKVINREVWENLKFLASERVNPNLQDYMGETPLHKAATVTSPFVWSTLINLGGDVWATNKAGDTPLDKAMRTRNTIAVSVMKEYLNRES